MMVVDDVIAPLRSKDDGNEMMTKEGKPALLDGIARRALRFTATSRRPTVIWVGRRSSTRTGCSVGLVPLAMFNRSL